MGFEKQGQPAYQKINPMNYEELKILLSNSPSVKLLRSKNTPLILSFLYEEFKVTERLTITNHDLVTRLADYMESLNFMDEEEAEEEEIAFEDYLARARRYIDEWCNEENRYLRKFPDETGESIHELTSETEKTFQWIDSLKKKAFVGTESRFLDIFTKLKDLIENSYEDPEIRIQELERKKKTIEDQINHIKISGKVDVLSNTQFKERFFEICKLGRELSADFKEVEQNFKDITREIYEKQMQEEVTKGKILGFALDATETLKESDQGKSFYAFWLFLIASDKQDELNQLINNVYDVINEREISASDPYLRNIKAYLYNAGQKVVASNHRLADKLSRVITERFLVDRQKTTQLINDIKKAAIEKMETPPANITFMEIEGPPNVFLTMDRPLGEPPQTANFLHQPEELGNEIIGPSDLESIFNTFEIDKELLKSQINEMLKAGNQVTLQDVIKKFPVTKGLAEIVTYLSIATDGPSHIINADLNTKVTFQAEEGQKRVHLPQVIYTR